MTKKVKTIIFISLLSAVLTSVVAIGCYASGAFDKNNHQTWYEDAKIGGITEADVDKIEAGMSLEEVVELVGKPQRDVGSGAFLLEWDMKSGDVLVVCFNHAVPDDDGSAPIVDPPEINLVSYDVYIKKK